MAIAVTTCGSDFFGFEPPILPGRMDPVSRYLKQNARRSSPIWPAAHRLSFGLVKYPAKMPEGMQKSRKQDCESMNRAKAIYNITQQNNASDQQSQWKKRGLTRTRQLDGFANKSETATGWAFFGGKNIQREVNFFP